MQFIIFLLGTYYVFLTTDIAHLSVCDVTLHVHVMEATQQLSTVQLEPLPLGKTHMLAVETLLCYLTEFLSFGFAITYFLLMY
jgi:hypothetical protein